MSGGRRRKSKRKSAPVKEIKSALDVLKDLKKLQANDQPKYEQATTVAGSGGSEQSVGSNDLAQDEITGGGLQWFEKLHNEKLNTVEARIGAQTTRMVMSIKSELEGKISDIRDSNTKHVTVIIVSIFIAFIVFYFAALDSVQEKVEASTTNKIDEVRGKVVELDKKIQAEIKGLTNKVRLCEERTTI